MSELKTTQSNSTLSNSLNLVNPIVDYLKISKEALLQIKVILSQRKEPCEGIRVGVRTRGCSGLSYEMTCVAESREGDQLFEDQGVRVLVEKKSLLYLLGTTLEYSGGLNGKGFEFKNPNATRTCGCGESFAV